MKKNSYKYKLNTFYKKTRKQKPKSKSKVGTLFFVETIPFTPIFCFLTEQTPHQNLRPRSLPWNPPESHLRLRQCQSSHRHRLQRYHRTRIPHLQPPRPSPVHLHTDHIFSHQRKTRNRQWRLFPSAKPKLQLRLHRKLQHGRHRRRPCIPSHQHLRAEPKCSLDQSEPTR